MDLFRAVPRPITASVFALIMVVSTAGVVSAAPVGPPGGAGATSAGAAHRVTLAHGATTRTVQQRPSVDVARLATRKPTVRPTRTLPLQTRQPTVMAPTTKTPTGAKTPKVVATPTPVAATTNADPAAAQPSFDGLNSSSNPFTATDPPDPWVAVGPDHIVQAVNLTLRMTDRSGGSVLDVSLPDFFGLPTDVDTFDSDPHVIYDSLHGRWIATEVSWDCDTSAGNQFGNGYIDFMVSDTTDPTGGWTGGYIGFSDALPDFPAPGTSTDKIGISSNLFDMVAGPDCVAGGAYESAMVDYMDWADATNGGTTSLWEVPFGPALFSIRVAAQVPATSAAMQQVAELDVGTAGQADLVYFVATGSVVAHTINLDTGFDITADNVAGPALDPAQPAQPGADTIDSAVDRRLTDAVWQGGRLVTVSTYPCGTGSRDCVRVTELATSGVDVNTDPTLTQDFLIGEAGKDLFMGGVGLSGDGTLHVGWTRSSGTDNPSSYAAHQLLGDVLGSISTPELLAAGTAAYAGERWGDYVGIAQDPQVPNQVFNANEYSGGADWLTKVTPLHTGGTTYVPIAPVRVLDTRVGNGLSGRFITNTARTWQVAGIGGIAADAVAITGNLTVTGQQSAGSVSVTVTPTSSPPSSSINFPLGETRANNLVVPLSPTGTVSAVFKGTKAKGTHLVFDVTGYFLADTTGATFTPITPVRAIDTRVGTGLAGKFLANTPRTLIVAGTDGIPADATAVTGNLVIVRPTKVGSAAVTKLPTATPSTSTVNFPASTNRANGVFAPLDGTGALSIVYNAAAGGTADVVFDLTGYFLPDLTGLTFVPLNPSRIVDTRPAGVLSGLTGKLASGAPRTLQVDGHWGVPLGAVAVTGNMTVTGPTAAGAVSATPTPDPAPSTSTINFLTGAVIANGFVGPLDGSGQISFVYQATGGKTTDLVIDLSGYFQ